MSSPRSSTSGMLSEMGKQTLSLELLQLELSKNITNDQRNDLVTKFWNYVYASGTPVCHQDKNGDYTVTFFYRANEDMTVELDCNDLNEQKLDKDGRVGLFQRIPNTDIYFFQVDGVPPYAIFPYGFYVTDQSGLTVGLQDTLCKDHFHLPICDLKSGETKFDERNASLLMMPEAKKLPYHERPSWSLNKKPEVTSSGKVSDFIFDATEKGFGQRKVWIYTPPDFDQDRKIKYTLMLMTDGGTYATLMPPHLNERSSVQPEIKNIIVAFVGNVREGSAKYNSIDLTGDPLKEDTDHRQYEFMDHSEEFYVNVISPIIDKLRNDPALHLNVSDDSKDTILAGFSLGGHFAAEVGLNHSDKIGNVVCLSGAFNTSIKSLAAVMPDNHNHDKVLNIFMSVGQLENVHQTAENQKKYHVTGESRVEANQHFAYALSSRGYHVQLAPLLPSGHNELSTMHVLTDKALPFVFASRADSELKKSILNDILEQSSSKFTHK